MRRLGAMICLIFWGCSNHDDHHVDVNYNPPPEEKPHRTPTPGPVPSPTPPQVVLPTTQQVTAASNDLKIATDAFVQALQTASLGQSILANSAQALSQQIDQYLQELPTHAVRDTMGVYPWIGKRHEALLDEWTRAPYANTSSTLKAALDKITLKMDALKKLMQPYTQGTELDQ